EKNRGIRLLYTLPPLFLALYIIVGVTVTTTVDLKWAILGEVMGIIMVIVTLYFGIYSYSLPQRHRINLIVGTCIGALGGAGLTLGKLDLTTRLCLALILF